MATPLDNRLIDVRTAERYLERGKLDRKAYESYLAELPDLADQAEPIETTFEASDETGKEAEKKESASKD